MKASKKRTLRKRKNADQGGVEPSQTAGQGHLWLFEATPHPRGNWSCAPQGAKAAAEVGVAVVIAVADGRAGCNTTPLAAKRSDKGQAVGIRFPQKI